MTSIGILVKSYGPDFAYAERLMASLDRHNVTRIPTWIVVPDEDISDFLPFENDHRHLIGESNFAHLLADEPIGGLAPGYANQEIVKLSFWELGLVDNYFAVDSDAVFVRDFGRSDLMFDDETPFTVLVEDNDLKVDSDYFERYWLARESSLKVIQFEMGMEDRRLLTCHGHQIMSGKVLRSLREDFMESRGWTYRDLLQRAPYEFSWYNMWLQHSQTIPIYAREPLIKVLHSADDHLRYAITGTTLADVSRGYLGIVVNSNFARTWGTDVAADEDSAVTISRYLSWSLIMRAVRIKARAALKSRFTKAS
jgi:hypothetical protein